MSPTWSIIAIIAAVLALTGLIWFLARRRHMSALEWKAAADAARDWAALLYTPILTLYLVWVTCLIVWAWPWDPATEPQRLNFLGFAMIGALCLIGLGTLFLQRRTATVKGKTAAGEFEVTSNEGQVAGRVNPETGAVTASAGAPIPPPNPGPPAAAKPAPAIKEASE